MDKPKVLIIDDDPTICNLLETILRMEEYQSASVTDIKAENIIALLDQEQPQLLILDLHLQSKKTLHLVPIIRSHELWKNLVILMTSGIDSRDECLEVGADEFIVKPFNFQQLTDIVKKIVL